MNSQSWHIFFFSPAEVKHDLRIIFNKIFQVEIINQQETINPSSQPIHLIGSETCLTSLLQCKAVILPMRPKEQWWINNKLKLEPNLLDPHDCGPGFPFPHGHWSSFNSHSSPRIYSLFSWHYLIVYDDMIKKHNIHVLALSKRHLSSHRCYKLLKRRAFVSLCIFHKF